MTDNDQQDQTEEFEGTSRRLAGIARIQTTAPDGSQVVMEPAGGWFKPTTPAEQALVDSYLEPDPDAAAADAVDEDEDRPGQPPLVAGPAATPAADGADATEPDKTAGPKSAAASGADKAPTKED